MARKRGSDSQKKTSEPVSSEERIARLLGLLLVKDIESKTEQVTLLRSAGFDISDVASMLGMTEHHVAVASHQGRKTIGKKKAKN